MKLINRLKAIKTELLVTAFFILIRLPYLGTDNFNTDVWKWKTRIFNFSTGLFTGDFANTLQRYHPGVTLMWLGAIGVKLNSFYFKVIKGAEPLDNAIVSIFTLHFFQKLTVVVALGVCTALLFNALSKLVDRKYAIVAIFMFSTEPFYYALSRELHLEGILSTFLLNTVVWFLLYIRHPQKKLYLIASSAFLALSVLTKTPALIVLPFIGLVLLNEHRRNLLLVFKYYLFWLLTGAVFFIALWPAMWVAPNNVVEALYRGIFETGIEEGHTQIYFGRFLDDPGLTFYPVVFLLKGSPYLLLGTVGLFVIFKKLVAIYDKKTILYFLSFAFVYLIFMSVPTKKLDRYIVPMIGFMSLSVSFFYVYILDLLNRYWRLLFCVLPLLTLAVVTPDYYSYFNPLFGGLQTGIKVLEPKWVIGHHEIAAYFDKDVSYQRFIDGESFDEYLLSPTVSNMLTVGFQEKYYTQIHPFITRIGGRAIIQDLTPHAVKTNFFVYPVWDERAFEENRFSLEYVTSIYLRGVHLYNVYRRI